MPSDNESAPEAHGAAGGPPTFSVRAYPLVVRVASVALECLAAANLCWLALRLVSDMLTGEVSAPPLLVARDLVLFTLLPLGLARLGRGRSAASVTVERAQLVLRIADTRYEIPLDAVAELRPWRLPLPAPGLSLRMKSGRHFRLHLELGDPAPLLRALDEMSGLGAAALAHPMTRHAHARSRVRRRWWKMALKFGLFPVLPTGVMFYLHQNIAYGGPLGEYHLLGLRAYLKTFVLFAIKTTALLVLWASLWRGLGELGAFALAWIAPARARGVRRVVEVGCGLVYYVGLPALILARILL